MKKLIFITSFFIIASSIFASELYQLGTIDSMMKGYYEKVKDINEIKSIASMGLGTTTNLGEVIGIEGKFYMADAEGKVQELNGITQVPYLTCSSFSPQITFRLDSEVKSAKEFYAFLEKEYLKSTNIFYAIRVDGLFEKVDARSEDLFSDKTEPLGEWLKTHQKSFIFENIRGTLVIFRFPQFMTGIGVGGYHAHFISANKKLGGHVFDFSLLRGRVYIESYSQITLVLPKTDKFLEANLGEAGIGDKKAIYKIETKEGK